MYHQPSRLRHVLSRVLVYSLMTIVVLLLVGVSVLYILGYRFDNEDHRVERSGLVQYLSKPAGASITIDGTTLSQKTPANSTVTAGTHTFTYSRPNYQTWTKTVDIKPGTVTWLNYARLIPSELTAQPVATLPGLADALSSPDRRFIATVPAANRPLIYLYDLTSEKVERSRLTLKASDYADAATKGVQHDFQLVEWDSHGRYLLVKHTYDTSIEWLVFDRQDGSLADNVTKTMALEMRDVHLVNDDGPVLYALVDGALRKVNLSRETVSRPLASNVAEYHVYKTDALSYVTKADPTTHEREVGLVRGDNKPVVIYTSKSKANIPVHVVAGHYFDEDAIVVSDGKKVTAYLGTFPRSQSDASRLQVTPIMTFPKDITWLGLNPEGRFVLAQTGNTFQTYDFERQEASDLLTLGDKNSARKLEWLDDYYLWNDTKSTLTIEDFDGANRHTIGTVVGGLRAVTLSPSGKYLYSFDSTKDGYRLQRVTLQLN